VHAIQLLASHPKIATLTDETGIREMSVPRRSYKIYYRIDGEEVWIIHIRDTRREPWRGDVEKNDE
jgi:plasmid stabilization system protein ParE